MFRWLCVIKPPHEQSKVPLRACPAREADALPALPTVGVEGDLAQRVAAVIDEFRPLVQSDGGDIQFVGVTDRRIVQVRMGGACAGCPSSFVTLQMGLERSLLERIPEIRGVENIA